MTTPKGLLRRLIVSALILATLAGLSGLTAMAAGVDSEGYTIITTAAELDTLVRNNVKGKFRLGADIDFTGYTSSTFTAAKGWKAIGYCSTDFQGVFDGNGHTIRGLWSKDWGGYQGLFSAASGAKIRNLHVELAANGISGLYYVGGIVGNAKSGTVVENCTVTGGKLAATCGSYAGGIVGFATGMTIQSCSVTNTAISATCNYVGGLAGAMTGKSSVSSCYTDANVAAKGTHAGGIVGYFYGASTLTRSCAVGDVSASCYAGGLAGILIEKVTVTQSCAYGNVTAKTCYAGGLAGAAHPSTISNCYAQGNVQGTTGVGGLVGYFAHCTSATVQNSYSSGTVIGKGTVDYGAFNGHSAVTYLGTNYYDKNTAGVSRGYGTAGAPKGNASSFPQGKTTSEMMKRATFVGWDFDTIWTIDENETYPYFWFWGFSVKYDANGGRGGFTDRVIGGKYLVKSAAETGVSMDHYTLVEWNTAPDGSGTKYTPGQTLSISGSMTLYAIWVYSGSTYYSVSYSANQGEGNYTASGIIPGTQHTVMSASAAGVARDNWTFTGWNTAADGSGTAYQPGDTIVITENKALYAQWTYSGAYYSVVYDAAGGYGQWIDDALMQGQQYTVKTGAETGVHLPPMTLIGWIDHSTGLTYQSGDQIIITRNMHLSALWG